MTINIQISEESVSKAITALNNIKTNINQGISDTIDILVKDGTMVAQAADGSMAVISGYRTDDKTGFITASGDAAIIAEFGAGDATLNASSLFNGTPPVPVYAGSFSESPKGSGEYAAKGKWHFGGKVYTEIVAKQGLFHAKDYIIKNAANIAKGVIKL